MTGLLLSGNDRTDTIYGPEERAQMAEHMDLICLPWGADAASVDHPALKEVEVILSTGRTPAVPCMEKSVLQLEEDGPEGARGEPLLRELTRGSVEPRN